MRLRAAQDGWDDLSPEPRDEIRRGGRLRLGGWKHRDQGRIAGRIEDRERYRGDTTIVTERRGELRAHRLVSARVDSHQQRPVEARSKALAEQIVCLTESRSLGIGTGVGRAQMQRRYRDGKPDQQEQGSHRYGTCMAGDETAPTGDQRVLTSRLRVVPRANERHPQPVDPVPKEPEHRRQQRNRRHHRGENGDGCAQTELGHKVESDHGQSRDGNRNRDPGEDHRATGRGARRGRRVLRRHALMQRLAEARHDEEGVIDAHAEADHGGEDRGDGIEAGQGRGERQQ